MNGDGPPTSRPDVGCRSVARGRADVHLLRTGSDRRDAVDLVSRCSVIGEVDLYPHAFLDVSEHPGVGRAELGAIVELDQIECAIDEADRAHFPGAVPSVRTLGRGVSEGHRHAECHGCQHHLITHVFSSFVRDSSEVGRLVVLSRVEYVPTRKVTGPVLCLRPWEGGRAWAGATRS